MDQASADAASARTVSRSTATAGPTWTKNGARGDHSTVHLVSVLGVDRKLAVSGRPDERIAAIAGRQRGRVSRAQLTAAGITRAAIRTRIRSGLLHPVPARVFAISGTLGIELGRETEALLAAGHEAALSHDSAAVLWGMQRAPQDRGRVHVVTANGRSRGLNGVRIHRSRNLTKRDICLHYGLPVTSPARTLLDQAERLTRRELELALDRGLVAKILRVDEIPELLARTRGRAAGPILRALAEHQQGPTLTRSAAEEKFLALIRAGQLPAPRVNARVHGYEVDFLWPEQRLVVEIDGFRYHSTRRAFEHDHKKDAVLRSFDLEVLRFTYHQLAEPMVVLVQVARRF